MQLILVKITPKKFRHGRIWTTIHHRNKPRRSPKFTNLHMNKLMRSANDINIIRATPMGVVKKGVPNAILQL